MILTLSKEGGFSEQEVLEMPVYRVNAYYHAALRQHDLWTVKESARPEVQIEHLLAFASVDNAEME